jgi:hypothetical protein
MPLKGDLVEKIILTDEQKADIVELVTEDMRLKKEGRDLAKQASVINSKLNIVKIELWNRIEKWYPETANKNFTFCPTDYSITETDDDDDNPLEKFKKMFGI